MKTARTWLVNNDYFKVTLRDSAVQQRVPIVWVYEHGYHSVHPAVYRSTEANLEVDVDPDGHMETDET